jgi:CopG family nickel-responsive transcriptional regulator
MNLILSTQHVHLEHDQCLETIAVKGKASRLIELSDKIIGTKGIKHGKTCKNRSLIFLQKE